MTPTPDTYTLSADGIKIAHRIRLTKPADRQLNDTKIAGQLDTIMAGVNTAARARRGWTVKSLNGRARRDFNYDDAQGRTGTYVYITDLDAVCLPDKPRPTFESEFQTILNVISAKAQVMRWKLTEVDGKPYNAAKALEQLDTEVAGDVGYAPFAIPDAWASNFEHLYGLDSHLRIIRSAMEAATLSGWRNRFHCVLIGPPGCGKSDICQSIKRALGEESVLEFDATSTTMAGAQKELQEREELPRVLLVEEIEKADEKSLAWLLSVLDLRAEIRKTTARGNILKDTKMFAIATVNNEDLFNASNAGALASRFSNKIHFQRPPRELLARILRREVGAVSGDERWIDPVLDYADSHNLSDPRAITALALCGRDGWLNGSYQVDLDNTRRQGGYENGV